MVFKFLSKKPPSPELTLDQSEWLVLKELSSFFLSIDFPRSQLEALLHARASPESKFNRTASISTPSPAVIPSSTSGTSEVDVDAQTIQPLVPSSAASTRSLTPQPSPSEFVSESNSGGPSTRLIVNDRSFEHSLIDGTGSSEPVVIDNFSHCAEDVNCAVTTAFSYSTIKNATVDSHSRIANVDCSNPGMINDYYYPI